MAALTILVCNAIRELYNLTDALAKNRFSLSKSLNYYKTRRRLQLFQYYCRQLCLRENLNSENNINTHIPNKTHDYSVGIMQRRGIDFAAIEATAEAYEAIDSFGLTSNREQQHVSTKGFLEAERNSFELIENYSDIEVIDGSEFNASFYEYSDSVLKYFNDQLGNLEEGISFTFTGKILINCERFSINFCLNNESRDIALHINPRLPQNYIVRNSKVQNVWGREEVSSALPFLLRRGENFSIQVLVTEVCFMISINGHHFAEYNHRLPYKCVKIIEVKGDVEQIEMERCKVDEYPRRLPESQAREIRLNLVDAIDEIDSNRDEFDGSHIPSDWRLIRIPKKLSMSTSECSDISDVGLPLPYYGTFPHKSLAEGRCLKILGRVRLLPHSFYINLQHGQHIWPHPTIALHFNPRFSQQSGEIGKAVVCRNSWYNGTWAEEERSELDTNFRPGKMFNLAIVCTADAFEVYVNRKYITEYKYQVKPDIVDTVYIQGDIKLWDVILENNSLIKGKNTRIYQNPIFIEEY